MARFTAQFSSYKQDWTTPKKMFDELNAEFHFTTDLAASEDNTLCEHYFDAETDALSQRWHGSCWLNPPYGAKLVDWISKAYAASRTTRGLTVVMLIPARTNTRWFHDYCMKAAEIRFLCGRPKFGDNKHGLPWPLALVVFRHGSRTTKFSTFRV